MDKKVHRKQSPKCGRREEGTGQRQQKALSTTDGKNGKLDIRHDRNVAV
jgi:hypothetical protein